MNLSILTISRTPEHLSELFGALAGDATARHAEVLISWNGSADDRKKIEIPAGLNVVIHDRSPYHFAKNNNYLASRASGEHLLFLNDDVVPDRDCLARAVRRLEDECVGIVGANLRYPNGSIQHAGILFNEQAKPYHRFKGEISWTDARVSNDLFVPAVTGAFLLVRAEEFRQILFDEAFEVAGEDVVFCLEYRRRFRREILYAGDVTALHVENLTRRQNNTRLTPEKDTLRIIGVATAEHEGGMLCQVRRPKVRIVTEQPGWIMHRKAAELQKHLGNVRINEDWPDADIHYYINYGKYRKRPGRGIIVANFTHYDPEHLGDRFVEVAHEVDHCIAVSEQTAEVLRGFGVPEEKISVILVGADASFRPKLTLGIAGRVYPGGRKGEDIVRELASDAAIDRSARIVASHEGWGVPVWKFDDPADFYRAIDYLLVPSRLEGGPVPFMEALACGTLSIAPAIGVVPQFPHISYSVGDVAHLKRVIEGLAEDHIRLRSGFSSLMHGLDWSGWAIMHDKLFRRLLSNRNWQAADLEKRSTAACG